MAAPAHPHTGSRVACYAWRWRDVRAHGGTEDEMEQFFLVDWRILMAGVAHWLAGGNPYGAYGGLLGEAHHAGAFAYPPPILLLGAPLALLPWQLSGLLVVAGSAAGFERWARRAHGRSALPWLLLWLPLVQGLVIGQTTLLALVALAFADLAYEQGHERRAGLLLALALLKPQAVLLPLGWLLLRAVRERRWAASLSFLAASAGLWGATLAVAGPEIVPQWLAGLRDYGPNLPNRPLIFPPLGPLLGLLAALLWWRHGRGDMVGALLLLNTLIYPLSVIYVAAAVALVVIRWRADWPWWPLALSWLPLVFTLPERTPDTIAALTQTIIATGLLAGLLPRLPGWRRQALPS